MLPSLNEVMTALFGDSGSVHDGFSESHAWELAIELYKNSPAKIVRIVRDWVWLDVQAPERDTAMLEEKGFMPAVLYAHAVIHDFSKDFDAGDWVCSTVLVKDSTSSMPIETKNSFYILVGRGYRRKVRPQVLTSIIHGAGFPW